ncbi:MAG: hypothetical protein A3D67_03415 [Candidatus Lloydbacteria bacterium RIFCSPHIGHO2_02_FULL_51_22]|uniref:Uncharacterized protein n=2 Tax=Candidatus Lloydiibacteriota TaxID=1817910 RepID=A0A1G2DCN2_9BACT|nr:MAG: hypothetical protein A3D67_03415 [Candidatus Lloydbacteria bacterium RIFCSPHIGHO2_02_FULL_51_22]OGZ14040.1 MAG: hypothetical protein A3J08_03880 [Candidatus Lloydbacteria bacterium RIFCSPLOWO2_02_FULL_51_11]
MARFKIMSPRSRYIKQIVGGACIFVGFLALVTPLTPGSWLILVGIELIFGFRPAFVDKFLRLFGTYSKKWLRRTTLTEHVVATVYTKDEEISANL